jgi:hypothetical protein
MSLKLRETESDRLLLTLLIRPCNGSVGYSPASHRGGPRSIPDVHVGFVEDKVALGQVLPRVLRFSSVRFIPPVLHYTENRRKIIIFLTGLHNKTQGCDASIASAAGPFATNKQTNKQTNNKS